MPEIDISMIYVIMKPIFDNVMHRKSQMLVMQIIY